MFPDAVATAKMSPTWLTAGPPSRSTLADTGEAALASHGRYVRHSPLSGFPGSNRTSATKIPADNFLKRTRATTGKHTDNHTKVISGNGQPQ